MSLKERTLFSTAPAKPETDPSQNVMQEHKRRVYTNTNGEIQAIQSPFCSVLITTPTSGVWRIRGHGVHLMYTADKNTPPNVGHATRCPQPKSADFGKPDSLGCMHPGTTPLVLHGVCGVMACDCDCTTVGDHLTHESIQLTWEMFGACTLGWEQACLPRNTRSVLP